MAERLSYRVEVRAGKCENKQTCLEVCPTNVFDLIRPATANPLLKLKIAVHGGLVATAAREADCVGCMACVEQCPEQAISVRYA